MVIYSFFLRGWRLTYHDRGRDWDAGLTAGIPCIPRKKKCAHQSLLTWSHSQTPSSWNLGSGNETSACGSYTSPTHFLQKSRWWTAVARAPPTFCKGAFVLLDSSSTEISVRVCEEFLRSIYHSYVISFNRQQEKVSSHSDSSRY